MGFIYCIENIITREKYVGQTIRHPNIRWKEHITDLHLSDKFHIAIKTYGINNFSLSILEETNDLDIRESYWIETLDSYNNGYNSNSGMRRKEIKHEYIMKPDSITWSQVENMRYDYFNNDISVYELASKYNISVYDVNDIVEYLCW